MPSFAPRSLAGRQTIAVEMSSDELHRLIRLIEAETSRAASDPDQTGYADYLFHRIAYLREAGR